MYFILNKSIKYAPDINELSIINEQQSSIVLSKPANRLLFVLIKNVNVVVSRGDLLKNVWEDYGYTPSNNNLYMAISELRKAFSSLGSETDFLTTVPKIGLKLVAIIDILDNSNHIDENLEVETSEVLIKKTPITQLGKAKMLLALVLIISSFIFYIIKQKNPLPIIDSQDAYVFRYGTCDVFSHTLSLGKISNIEAFKKDIIDKLNKYGIFCRDLKMTVYFQYIFGGPGPSNGVFIGVCTQIDSRGKRKCETFKGIPE